MFQTKVVEKVRTHVLYSTTSPPHPQIMRYVEKYGRVRQATDDSTVHALRMLDNQGPDTHSEYITVIALPRQQWLHESASMLRYTCIACPVTIC